MICLYYLFSYIITIFWHSTSSVVRAFVYGAMGRRIDLSWGGPIELFLVQASAPRLGNKGRGMRYPVCGMMHIKEPLLLIGKSSPCGGSRFPPSQSEWSFTICMTPYNPKQNVLSASLNKTIPSFLTFYIKFSGTHTCMYTEYKI